MNTKKLMLTALTVTLLSGTAVFAQGNSNGNGNGHGNANGHGANGNGNNGNGAIASELKWRNAAHASEQAFLNADPDSAVGKLAALRDAAQATTDAYAAAGVDSEDPLRDPVDIQADIDAISGAGGLIELAEGEVAALDPASPTYEAELADLLEEIATLEASATQLGVELALPTTLEGTQAAEDEAGAVVGVGDLSPEALVALWELLNK